MIESTLIALSLQVIVALTILNVWFFRASKQTQFRCADARSLSEEFQQFGLSRRAFMLTSIIKPMLAVSLLVAIFFPFLTKPSALALALFMLGALLMHLKVRDEFKKFLPALSIFAGCVAIIALS